MMHIIRLVAIVLIVDSGTLQSAILQQECSYQPSYDSYSLTGNDESVAAIDDPLTWHSESYASSESVGQALNYLGTTPGSDWVQPSGMRFNDDRGIRYISGGVGEGERDLLKTVSDQFNLRLQFTISGSGKYLSEVDVSIQNKHGENILTAKSKGPWFFAKLEPGNYSVKVSESGQQLHSQPPQQTVQINDSHQQRLDFYWR